VTGEGWQVERLTDRTEFETVAALESAAFNRPVPATGLEMALERPDVFRIYVLRLPERPVAAFCACALVVDELHISTIAVAPEYRRRGVATRLMQQVLADAAAEGAGRATLEVRVSNTAARKLYERLGFSVAAVRKGYYAAPEEDGLILWREPVTSP
jgi:[ribosomal protein S18]-alanine N-acetyltransferase